MGYHQAGFEVVGIDIAPQPRFPFEFIQADVFEVLSDASFVATFDAIHASPPCRDHTSLTSVAGIDGTGWMLEEMRRRLLDLNVPWVIENVPGAPMRPDVVLCGAMFGLRTYRHRWFELSDPMFPPTIPHPVHTVRTATKRRREAWAAGMNVSITGDVGVYLGPDAMGIDWMSGNELSQAIPPAYTKHVGGHLLSMVQANSGLGEVEPPARGITGGSTGATLPAG
jgi:DNA (cytosine-5)-methyltransferase 1